MQAHVQGFTLVELIIVLVIAAILAAVAVPSYQQMMENGVGLVAIHGEH